MMSRNERLTATFTALAHPTRRAILARLVMGEINVMDLARPFDLSQPAISKHLKVLERAGLVSRGREKQARPVRLEAAPLADAVKWLEAYKRFWSESFDRLDDVLDDMKVKEREKRPKR